MRLLIVLVLSLFSGKLPADTLKLVSGEYTPYSGEKLLEGGVSTQIVRAAFAESSRDISVEFTPWNRAMNNLKSGSVSGSFPWTKNRAREKDFYFSDIVHHFRLLIFVNKVSSIDKKSHLSGKKICLPSGWDAGFIQAMIDKNKMSFERPMNLESCFQMLAINRIDLVVVNELVGLDVVNRLYKEKTPFKFSEKSDTADNTNLYFIIPKNVTGAKKILEDFNKGLAIIKRNGKYDAIVSALKIN